MPEFQDTAGSKKREAKIFTFYRNEEEVSLKGEFYFIKFKINQKEDDVEPNVILERSFVRLAKGIVDFGNGIITIYPDFDLFSDESDTAGNNEENRELMFDLDEIEETELPPLNCKMGKSSRNKKRVLESFQICYPNEGPSRSKGEPMTQEEAPREKLEILLDEICLDKNKLDEAMKDEQKESIKRVKGEALIEKENPGAFIFPIRLEGKINLNGLADTCFEVNVMPYRIYMDLGREKVKKVNRGIEMINHSLAEPMGLLKDVLCQIGVTTIIAMFLILDIPIDRDTQIMVGRGFLSTCGGVLDIIDRVMSTYDGFKRDKFSAPTYGPKSAKYLNITEPKDRSLALQAALNLFHQICVWKKAASFLRSLPVPLQHLDWKPEYNGYHKNEEAGTGQWKAEIRLTYPYGNIYNQGFTTKKTSIKLAKYHKLSDIMSPNYFRG
ncbi:hypothetical protein Tco_0885070 [Tanacetum coccineum]